jgi:hypothetical protein
MEMKLLGMEVFPRRQTDAEHILSVRKMVGRSKWLAVLDWAIAGLLLATYCVIYNFVMNMEEMFPGLSVDLAPGFKIGVMVGLLQGMLIFTAALGIGAGIKIFTDWRTERLMLQFHDELQQRDSQGTNQTS